MCGARYLHPAGVSTRCLAPFSYELHLRGAKRTTAVISSKTTQYKLGHKHVVTYSNVFIVHQLG